MATVEVLRSSIQHTHESLAARLDSASTTVSTRGQPRKGYERIDTFLTVASKHLNAVDDALLPAARKRLPDGHQVVHDYLRSARELELALAHVKARAYGSVYDAGRSWGSVWSDVESSLANQFRLETDLADQLTESMQGEEVGALDDLTERLHRSESAAPTRPHPYTPHTGLAGLVARRIMHAVDSFWDTAEGRMAPAPTRPPHEKPGLVAQYLLADPRFDEDQPPRH